MTTTTTPALDAPLRGDAVRHVADLGPRARLCDLYDDRGAAIYDDTGILDASEIRELGRLVRRHPGAVLELAAGSGRLTLPLLRLGRPLTALELSEDMIALLREAASRTRGGERLEVVRADMADFDLGRRFEVVVLGASSVSLLDAEGRRGLYASCRRHLAHDGVLYLSVAGIGADDPTGVLDETHDVVGRSGRRYRTHQYCAPGDERRSVCVYPLDVPTDEEIPVCVSAPRLVEQTMITAELAGAGLDVSAVHPIATGSGEAAHLVMLEVRAR